ncbi:hypothetical protein [Streptomyces iranensis]|uniref:hypothetical protein n=1 Tax=Streptomyces iranensis TaxID=576784 RepID=UPI0039B742D8
MTIVPLPKQSADMCRRFAMVAHPQWMPGNTFRGHLEEADHKVGLNSLVLQNPAVAGTVFNLLLLLPLGVFLRYHSGARCPPPPRSASRSRCPSS